MSKFQEVEKPEFILEVSVSDTPKGEELLAYPAIPESCTHEGLAYPTCVPCVYPEEKWAAPNTALSYDWHNRKEILTSMC